REDARTYVWLSIGRVAWRCGDRWWRADIKVSAGEPGFQSCEPRATGGIETAQLVDQATRDEQHHSDQYHSIDELGRARDCPELGVQRLRERHHDQRAEQRPDGMTYAADEIDDQRLHRHANAEHRFRGHHKKHLRVDDAK